MTMNPTRAEDRLEKTQKTIQGFRDKIKSLLVDKNKLADDCVVNLGKIEANVALAGLTDSPEADKLRAEAVKLNAEVEAARVMAAEIDAQIPSLELSIAFWEPIEILQKAAYEKMVREYPVALARHLRHMRHSRMTDNKSRTANHVKAAREEAEGLVVSRSTPGEALAKKLAGE